MGFFVRHGAWCRKCRASLNYAGSVSEKGLCVFECERVGSGQWKLREKAWTDAADTLSKTDGPWLLVEGEEIRKGADGEPVLGAGFTLKARLGPTPDRDTFQEIEGGEPPAFYHENNCVPPKAKDVYAEAAASMYGEEDDDLRDEEADGN
jgi:hypothetical protein